MSTMAEKEYIEKRKLIKAWEREIEDATDLRDAFDFALEDVPAADVMEVVHGEWIPSPDGIHPIKCSNCGADAPYRRESDFTHDIGIRPYKSNYCPNCGAKMDGGKHG